MKSLMSLSALSGDLGFALVIMESLALLAIPVYYRYGYAYAMFIMIVPAVLFIVMLANELVQNGGRIHLTNFEAVMIFITGGTMIFVILHHSWDEFKD